MEQSPWETDSSSISREISHLLWNPKVHYRFHKSTPLDPNLSHSEPIHILTLHFLTIYFNIILQSKLRREQNQKEHISF
jgi:hypothetical protein